ncbi:MAG: UDP-N-acetylmuramoyl-tripeptide--D-alanyl-D-alanine ligase [Bacteroidetes bacterium]|jgi:UDP-N-acetylmuramoyl-tripeptide--D-alanyl-D-alanine ligase|nr:UDP-N-acetylmuramoyl-tripeptide--D-alanyl-D-alanine ligase [Bacteroidota bacterium]
MMEKDIQLLLEQFKQSTGICTDTRKVQPGNLFFALKGPNFNGNHFALQALELGANMAVVDEETNSDAPRLLRVPHALSALQQLAQAHRRSLSMPILAISGSNGKTTSKELLAAVLGRKYNTYHTPGNLNNHIGVPLSLLQITLAHEVAVIEMGANHLHEHETLCAIAQPNMGVITNNGKDHLEGFGSLAGVIAANTEVYAYLRQKGGRVYVNADDPVLMDLSQGMDRLTYGNSAGADCQVELLGRFPYATVRVRHAAAGVNAVVHSQLFGSFQLYNIGLAACVAIDMGVETNQMVQALEAYAPANMRTQLLHWRGNQILLDAYNANPSSMAAVLADFGQLRHPLKGVVLGDMFELGENSDAEHAQIADMVAAQGYNWVAMVGPLFAKQPREGFIYLPNQTAAKQWLVSQQLVDHFILIKGSRGMQLEKILE